MSDRRRRPTRRDPLHRGQISSSSLPLGLSGLILSSAAVPSVLVGASCDESIYSDGSDCNDTVLGVLQTSPTVYGTLIVYALLLSIIGWAALLYPFFYIRRFHKKVRMYMQTGVKKPAVIVSMRRGRVFNPLRFCLPSRYNCYVTVEYASEGGTGTYSAVAPVAPAAADTEGAGVASAAGGGGGGSSSLAASSETPTIRKELAVDEKALQLLVDRQSHSIDVYTVPDYPQSGMLDDVYQGHKITTPAKVGYALAAAILLGLAFWLSFGTTSDVIFASSNLWKFWLVLLGHLASFGLALWGCHFVYRKRVEALLYGTIDDGTAAYGRCGVATMDAKGDGGAGTVELADTNVSSASMNSLEAGADAVAAKKAAESAAAGGGGAQGSEQPYHAMT